MRSVIQLSVVIAVTIFYVSRIKIKDRSRLYFAIFLGLFSFVNIIWHPVVYARLGTLLGVREAGWLFIPVFGLTGMWAAIQAFNLILFGRERHWQTAIHVIGVVIMIGLFGYITTNYPHITRNSLAMPLPVLSFYVVRNLHAMFITSLICLILYRLSSESNSLAAQVRWLTMLFGGFSGITYFISKLSRSIVLYFDTSADVSAFSFVMSVTQFACLAFVAFFFPLRWFEVVSAPVTYIQKNMQVRRLAQLYKFLSSVSSANVLGYEEPSVKLFAPSEELDFVLYRYIIGILDKMQDVEDSGDKHKLPQHVQQLYEIRDQDFDVLVRRLRV